MKGLYLTGSIIFTVLILVLAFENIGASCNQMYFFFFPIRSNPTIITLALAVLGILTGMLYHAFMSKTMEKSEEDEDF
ncbi:hypothetical protein KJ632_05335 [Patescibacteria group bacterium]|nr:hypothetical protein [Patescibacteria group bacterium]